MQLQQVVQDFNLPELDTFEEVVKALNALGFTHTYLRASPRPEPLNILFNPWTMQIIKGPYKGHFIESINNLSYKSFFKQIQPFVAPAHASRHHIKFVSDLLRFRMPDRLMVSVKGVGGAIPVGGSVFNHNTELPQETFVQDNHVYIKNFAGGKEDMSYIREAIERVRDNYDEWVIDLGSGGDRLEVSKILVAFFNPEELPRDLLDSRIFRPRTIWATSDYPETDTTFRQYAFQGLQPKLSSYQGSIKIIIGGGVGSASYVFAAFALLMGGKWKIKEDVYLTSKKRSRVQFIARSDYNRVSNRFNGEDGGHLTGSGLKRPNITWKNPNQHLIGYFLLGRYIKN